MPAETATVFCNTSFTVLTLDKAKRLATLEIGDNFVAERDAILKIVSDALDVLEGKAKSVVDIERFAILRRIEAVQHP